MKNYLKTQQNEFGQNVGFSLKHNLSIQPISGTLKGQYINLIDVAEGLSEQAASLIWDCVVTEPSEECWTYLPYSAPQSQIALKNNLQNEKCDVQSHHTLLKLLMRNNYDLNYFFSTNVIPHLGHLPDLSLTSSGCIGQVYSVPISATGGSTVIVAWRLR